VAGNRTVDQTDDAVFATTHDSMNRLQSRAPGGPIVFSGSLDEAATVTIDGKPAEVDSSNNFRGTATLSGATTTVTLKAKDYSGNETTKQYEVDASGSTTSYTYDANGNLTSDGTKTYFWNALNQLVEVKEGTTTIATFEYDGAGRRTEKIAAGLTHQYIYDAEDIVEERIYGSSSDTIRYYHGSGIDEPLARKNAADVVTYYLADHLGSIVQETNASGAVALEREYGPWGDLLSGTSTAGYAFQGREWDSEIGLYYFRARYYNAAAGAWASEDPIGFAGGTNFSRFVNNNPTRFVDPLGLCGEDQGRSPMRVSDDLIRLLKNYEKLEQKRYRDQGGKVTIGYGHRVYGGDTVTAVSEIGATEILVRDLQRFENAVNTQIKASLTQNEFDALVMLTFNIGADGLSRSNLKANLNSGRPIIEDNFTSWNLVDGVPSAGLTNRRWSEWLVFTTGTYRRY